MVRRTHASDVDKSHWRRKFWRRPLMGSGDRESFAPAEGLGAGTTKRTFGSLLCPAPVMEMLSVCQAISSLKRLPVRRGPPRSGGGPKGLPLGVRGVTSVLPAVRQNFAFIFVLNEDWVKRGSKQVGGLVWSCSELPFGLDIGFPMTKPKEPPRGDRGGEGPGGKFNRI